MELITAHVTQQADLHLNLKTSSAGSNIERVDWEVINQGTVAFHGALRLQLPLPATHPSPWFMIPGFLYGENRKVGDTAREDCYPRYDPSIDQPHRMASNHWDFAADRTSYPLIYAYQDGRCFVLASAPHVTLSPGCQSDDWEPQVGIGFQCNGQGGNVRVNFPACEEPFTYAESTQSGPTIRRVTIPPGGSISGTIWRMDFAGVRHDYQQALEFYYETVSAAYAAAEADDSLALMRDAVHGIVNWHYNEPQRYFVYSRSYDRVAEQIANAKGVTLEWHQMNTGFVSGLPICWGLATAARALDNARAREVSRVVADRICTEGVSPSGLFWADFRPGIIKERNGEFPNALAKDGKDVWSTGWWPEPGCVHARTIADANYSLANLILVEASIDPTSPSLPLWRKALRGNLEAILDLQLPSGSYGAVYDAINRKVHREEGCGGLLWIPALLTACEVFRDDADFVARLEASVRRAGSAYAANVEEEYIWGAPEDNDSPTSEDGLNAVLAYHALYRRFGDPRDLALLTLAAEWMLSFRKSYNQRMHPGTLMGAYGMRSLGGDFASVSNNHLHVFEVMTTTALCDLTRWTGREYFRKRALEHWAFSQQMLCRVDGQYNGFRGGMAEQFYWTNWSSFGQDTRMLETDGFTGAWDPGPHHRQKGNLAGFSTIWCINIILLGAEMIMREAERNV
ncbi:MAG: hypothetical protein ACYC7E_02510 [Armatimonadota bacterium]